MALIQLHKGEIINSEEIRQAHKNGSSEVVVFLTNGSSVKIDDSSGELWRSLEKACVK